jgi:aspartyl-tRNA(Asn)/glutamyl-tRNA(Gln) amidotransferase subunit A
MTDVSLKGLRIGVPEEFFNESLNPDVAGVVRAKLE